MFDVTDRPFVVTACPCIFFPPSSPLSSFSSSSSPLHRAVLHRASFTCTSEAWMTLAVINTQESRNTGSHIRRPRVGGTRFKVIRVRTIIDRSPELSFLNFHSRGVERTSRSNEKFPSTGCNNAPRYASRTAPMLIRGRRNFSSNLERSSSRGGEGSPYKGCHRPGTG